MIRVIIVLALAAYVFVQWGADLRKVTVKTDRTAQIEANHQF